jgi:hypothetical protein
MSRDKRGIAEENFELIDRDEHIKDSWLIQTRFQHDFDRAAELLFGEGDLPRILCALESLRLRGQLQICGRLREMLVQKRGGDLTPNQLEFLTTTSTAEPGVYSPGHVLEKIYS